MSNFKKIRPVEAELPHANDKFDGAKSGFSQLRTRQTNVELQQHVHCTPLHTHAPEKYNIS